MALYTYSIQNHFLNSKVFPEKLLAEIRTSNIVIACDGVTTNEDICNVIFKQEITQADKTILDNLVYSHDGLEGDFNQIIPTPIVPMTIDSFKEFFSTSEPISNIGKKALDVYIHGKLTDTLHNDLPEQQGGNLTERYHLNANEHNELTLGNITILHKHNHSDLNGTHNLTSNINHNLISNVGVNTHGQIDSHLVSALNPHGTTKGQVGLGSVDNIQQMPLSYLDTDITLSANSDTKVATQKAVKTYIANYVSSIDFMVYKGLINCSGTPNYPAGDAGNTWRVSTGGRIGGASGVIVEIGDMIICSSDATPAGDQATVGMYWNVIQANTDGIVIGDINSTDNAIVRFNGINGKIIQNSLVTINDAGLINIPLGQTYNINGLPHTHTSNQITDLDIYTDEEAIDAVGTILLDTNSIDLTYDNVNRTIKADVKKQNGATIDLSIDVSGLKAELNAILKASYDSAVSHISKTDNPHATTKSQVGLGSVDNLQQIPLSYLDTDINLTLNSDLKVATQKATKAYVDFKIGSVSGSNSRMRVYQSPAVAAQNIPNNTWVKMTYDGMIYDSNAEFSWANNRFTAKQEGFYRLNAAFILASTSSAGNQEIAIYKNGARYSSISGRKTGSKVSSVAISDAIYLAEEDYVEIYAFQDSGSSKSTYSISGYNSYWSMQKES